MIYGANGYTGRLIVKRALALGMKPIVAGRNRSALEKMAAEFRLPSRVFDLSSSSEIQRNLNGARLVLHVAGPFSATSKPMLDACIATRVHYCDITGEIDVFESIFARSSEIAAAGIVAVPGVGFDVVPTDCVAAILAQRLPEAVRLELAFFTRSGASAGTTNTMIESLHKPVAVRRGGKLTALQHGDPALRGRMINFGSTGARSSTGAGSSEVWCLPISWGDVSTAWHSTGIDDVGVWAAIPKRVGQLAGAARHLGPLLQATPVQDFLKSLASRMIKGDDPEQLAKGWGLVRGVAFDRSGRSATMLLRTGHPYEFTALASLAAAGRILVGEVPPGAWTPSKAFGSAFVLQLPGVDELS
jgi:short subunit dehydrogenase-like uncharacterized protein